jgi:hypothetical protein
MTLSATLFSVLLSALPQGQGGTNEVRPYFSSVRVHQDGTATMPLHQGRVGTQTVWFLVIDASNSRMADRFGCNRANKLANARGTDAVQRGRFDGNVLVMPGTVDFAPQRVVVGDPVTGFPPLEVHAGSVADAEYSPLVQLTDGSVLNAPQLINDSGIHDKVVSYDLALRTVRLRLTDGFARGNRVIYLSTEASVEVAAALEGATLTPRLNAAPFAGGDGTNSARAGLAAFVNGPTGLQNPERQGLNSALLGEGDPLNVLAWTPNQGRYSPLWDVHLTAWRTSLLASRQTAFDDVEDLAESGLVTAPDGSAFGPSDFVVNCPIVAEVRTR